MGRVLEASKQGSVWDVVLIEAGVSKNGVLYSEDVLRGSEALFEGADAMLYKFEDKDGFYLKGGGTVNDHLPDAVVEKKPEGLVGNLVGSFKGVRFGTFKRPDGSTGEGLLAKLNVSETAPWLRTIMRERQAAGRPLGLSIDAFCNYHWGTVSGKPVRVADKIVEVSSVDIVTRPAAGGGALRMVASLGIITKGKQMKDLLKLLAKVKESWLDGFDLDAAEDRDALVVPVLESAIEKEESEALALEPGERFNEASRGVMTLKRVLDSVKKGDSDAAVKLLEEWISNYPAPAAKEAAHNDKDKDKKKKKKDEEEDEDAMALAASAKESDLDTKIKRFEALDKKLGDREKRLTARESVTELGEKLTDSGLPKEAQEMIRSQFEGESPSDEKIERAIEAARSFVAAASKAGNVTGCGNVKIKEDQREKWSKAMDAMLTEQPSIDGVSAFAGLHESFSEITGIRKQPIDQAKVMMRAMIYSIPGEPGENVAEHHQHVRESYLHFGSRFTEALLSTTWGEILGDSVTRQLQAEATKHPWNRWRDVVNITSPRDFRTNRRIRLGGFGDLDTVGEDGTYQEFGIQPNDEEVTYAVQKRGNLYPFTMEAMVNDDLEALKRASTNLGQAARRTLFRFVFGTLMFDNPLTDYDAASLISAGHSNTTAAALSYDEVQTGIIAMMDQTELDSGEPLAIQAKYLAVSNTLIPTAFEIVQSPVKITAGEDATVPAWVKELGLSVLPVPTELSTADWLLIGDKSSVPLIEIGFLGGKQEPELFIQDQPTIGAVFSADRMTYKIRHIYGGDVLDHRGFYGRLT